MKTVGGDSFCRNIAGQTDGRTDGRTDGQTDRNLNPHLISFAFFFFFKKAKLIIAKLS